MSNRFIFRDRDGRKRIVEVLFEDDRYLIVNKPAGVPVIPDRWRSELPNLRHLLEAQYRKAPHGADEQSVWVVHRLDTDTSGVLMMARSADSHRFLNALFEAGEVEKTYLAIVRGAPPAESGVIDQPIRPHPSRKPHMQVHPGGKPAVTEYQVLEKFRYYSLLEARPKTGRTHQLRVHLAVVGCPLAVDPLYGEGDAVYLSDFKRGYREPKSKAPRPLIGRLTLHAHTLAFTEPASGQRHSFQAPLPKDFQALLKALRKWDG